MTAARTYPRGMIQDALLALNREASLGARDFGDGIRDVVSRAGWESHTWPNRARVPKPAWSTILNGIARTRTNYWRLAWRGKIDLELDTMIETISRQPVTVAGLGESLHVGAGAPQLAGLVHKYGHAGDLGVGFRRSVVRTEDGTAVDLWHENHLRDYLEAVVEQRDHAKSARNLFYADAVALYNALIETSNDDSARDDAGHTLDALFANLRAEITTRMGRVVTGAIPSDPRVARVVLDERIEAAAGARRAYLLGAFGRQGALIASGTSTQASALRTVAHRRQQGHIELHRATTVAAMQTIARNAITRINQVLADDSPVWSRLSADGTATPISGPTHTPTWTYSSTATGAQTVVRLRASNPTTAQQTGNVAITEIDEALDGVTVATIAAQSTETYHDAIVRYEGAAPASTKAAVLTARNALGPTTLTIHF